MRARWRVLGALAGAATVAGTLLAPAVGTGVGSGVAGASAARPSYIAAAEYFGNGNPTNLWSSDLSGAPAAFARMQQDGFNTVGLIVPWDEFQTHLTPPRYDQQALQRLDRVIGDAQALGMGVILRLSYEFAVDPADQLPEASRFDEVWSNPKVYSAWLGYIAEIHRSVARYHNVREAYISWEDLWEPVFEAQGTSTASQQLALATTTGYRTWLRAHHTLAQVEFDYGTQFADWTAVPTPPADKPSFKLMYQYQDTALVHRMFVPASKRFPGLTMETRVDIDPLYTGTQVVGSYTHQAQYQLPGTSVTGMYFSPYMDDPSSTPVETSSQGVAALQSTLSRMHSQSGGRPLFIYEYEIESNSPVVAQNPALTTNQIPTFMAQSEPLLHQYTAGYALWTYQDYHQSPLYNQSFALGGAGWTLTGGARAAPSATATSYATLQRGGTATQHIVTGGVQGTAPATVTLRARAGTATTLDVQWGTGAAQAVPVTAGGWHTYQVTVPASSVDDLSLRAGGAVSVTDVQLFWYSQVGDVYSPTGTAEVGAGTLAPLNRQLTAGG